MRKRACLTIAAAVVMCVASVADAQPGGRGRGGPGAPGGAGGFGFGKLQLLQLEAVQKELELTDAQVEKIAKLQEELRGDSPFGGGRNFQGRGRGDSGNRERGEGGNRERGEGERRRGRPQSENEEGASFEFQSGEYFVQDQRGPTDEEREQRREEFRKMLEERQQKEKDGIAKILLPHQVKRLNEIHIQVLGLRALQDPAIAAELKITDKQQEKINEVQQEAREKFRDNADLREAFQSRDQEKIREAMAKVQKETEKDVLGCLTSSQRKQFEKMKGDAFELDRSALFGGFRGRGQGGPGGPRGEGEGEGDRPQRNRRPSA